MDYFVEFRAICIYPRVSGDVMLTMVQMRRLQYEPIRVVYLTPDHGAEGNIRKIFLIGHYVYERMMPNSKETVLTLPFTYS